jgi:hypothetical protein
VKESEEVMEQLETLRDSDVIPKANDDSYKACDLADSLHRTPYATIDHALDVIRDMQETIHKLYASVQLADIRKLLEKKAPAKKVAATKPKGTHKSEATKVAEQRAAQIKAAQKKAKEEVQVTMDRLGEETDKTNEKEEEILKDL